MKNSVVADINWVSPQQNLLLKAALLPGEKAAQAWEEWKSKTVLKDTRPDSINLLPKVYFNLQGKVDNDLFFNACRELYRQTWLKNQLLFNAVLPVLKIISEENIKILLFKGAGLTLRYYHDLGLRPMEMKKCIYKR